MSIKSSTQGTELLRSDDGTTFTQVEGLVTINTPKNAKDQLDSTDLSSTSMESIAGLGAIESLSFSVYIDLADPTHQALIADNESGTTLDWKIRIPEVGGTFTDYAFKAYVGEFGSDVAINIVNTYAGTLVLGEKTAPVHGVTA